MHEDLYVSLRGRERGVNGWECVGGGACRGIGDIRGNGDVREIGNMRGKRDTSHCWPFPQVQHFKVNACSIDHFAHDAIESIYFPH